MRGAFKSIKKKKHGRKEGIAEEDPLSSKEKRPCLEEKKRKEIDQGGNHDRVEKKKVRL